MSKVEVSKDIVLTPVQLKKQQRNELFRLANPEYNAEYYEANKERLHVNNKAWRLEHNEQIKKYRKDNEARNRAYALKYHADNLERLMTVHQCECGGRYSYKHKARHERSNIHFRSLELAYKHRSFFINQ